jgi:hypothetical protein
MVVEMKTEEEEKKYLCFPQQTAATRALAQQGGVSLSLTHTHTGSTIIIITTTITLLRGSFFAYVPET